MQPIFTALRTAVIEAEGIERELEQARRDLVRVVDDFKQLEAECARLREQLAAALMPRTMGDA